PPSTTTTTIDTSILPATTFVSSHLNSIEPSIPTQAKPIYNALIKDSFLPRLQSLEKYTHSFPLLISLYKQAGIPPFTFAVAVIVAALIVVRRAIKANAPLVSNLVGVLYPAYRSIKAVETPQQDDDERFLTYWPLFGAFTITDQFSARILRYFPLYFTTKMAVLYWLFNKNGSLMFYRQVARPLLVKYGGLGAKASASSTPTTAGARSRETSFVPVIPHH
ncbi:hypothetical protein HDU76_008570, partial [Blyttiomyces sp. JEL0837]